MELPVYEIEGTPFQVDVIAREMRECANPANIIGFHEMIDNKESYSFYYDPEEKNISCQSVNPGIYVTIPQMRQLDPVTMAMHYNFLVADMNLKTDYEIIVDDDLVKKRLSGALPIIKLMDYPFYVDERLGSLRPKDDFRTMGIYFDDMVEVNDRELGFIYDPEKHAIAELNIETIVKVPKDLYLLHVSPPEILDPAGWARNHGFDLKEVLRQYPPQRDLKATVIPWSETPLIEIIEKNIQKNISLWAKNQIKEEKKQRKMKRGRGLH